MLVSKKPRYTATHRCESWYQSVLKKQSELIPLEEHIRKIKQNQQCYGE
jgi:hypothetical protein